MNPGRGRREGWRELRFHRVAKAAPQPVQCAAERGLIGTALAGQRTERTVRGVAIEVRFEQGEFRRLSRRAPLPLNDVESSMHDVQRPLPVEQPLTIAFVRNNRLEERTIEAKAA